MSYAENARVASDSEAGPPLYDGRDEGRAAPCCTNCDHFRFGVQAFDASSAV